MTSARWIGLLGVLAFGCGKSGQAPAPIDVEAPALVNEYKDNEVAADVKYTKKVLRIKGVIREIGKEKGLSDTAFVDLGSSWPIGAKVRCYFKKPNEGQFTGLEKGGKVTLLGTCDGVHVSLKSRLVGEDFEDKLKKLNGHFITVNDCSVVGDP